MNTAEAEDFFSPGSDLVLCILAMAVLMLILVGVSFRPELYDKQKVGKEVTKTESAADGARISELAETVDRLREENSAQKTLLMKQSQQLSEALTENGKNLTLTGLQKQRLDEAEQQRVRLQLIVESQRQQIQQLLTTAQTTQSQEQTETGRLVLLVEAQKRRLGELEQEKGRFQSVAENQLLRIQQLEAVGRATQLQDRDRVVLKPSSGRSPYQQNGYDLSEFGLAELLNGLRAKRDEFVQSGANTLLVEGFASAEPDRTTDIRLLWNMPAYRVLECNRENIRETKDCREHFTFDRNLDLAFRRARRVWEHLVFLRGLPRWCATIVTHGRNRSLTLEGAAGKLADEGRIRSWDALWPDNTDGAQRTSNPPPMAQEDARLSSERKVEVRAISDPNSRCRSEDLAEALKRL